METHVLGKNMNFQIPEYDHAVLSSCLKSWYSFRWQKVGFYHRELLLI